MRARRRPGAGRPRLVLYFGNASPRDQILDAAPRLFVELGYSGTSTREIAEACGIRQATLDRYFDGKHAILAEVLELSARPDLDTIERIEAICPPDAPDVALYLLALSDVRALAAAPHNACLLHRMPDVRATVAYRQIQPMLHDLGLAYGRLGAAVLKSTLATTVGPNEVRLMLTKVVEAVTTTRNSGRLITRAQTRAIASTCLRACGLPDEQIEYAAATAMRLVSEESGVGMHA